MSLAHFLLLTLHTFVLFMQQLYYKNKNNLQMCEKRVDKYMYIEYYIISRIKATAFDSEWGVKEWLI